MLKYLLVSSDRLNSLKNGMESNAVPWQNQSITPATLQQRIDRLAVFGREIDGLKEQLENKQTEAHDYVNECEDFADQVESLVIGIEGTSVTKLRLYGIEPRKEIVRKTRPVKTLIPTIEDDSDGVGFVLSTQSDPDAEQYEWQKGIGADTTKTDAIPEFRHLTFTAKLSYVDDDVPKGIRMFYRVRAVNRAGKGPWSEAVSKVQ
jgi:hypothetical protein